MRQSVLFIIYLVAALSFSNCNTIYDEPDVWRPEFETLTNHDFSDIVREDVIGDTFFSFHLTEKMDGDIALNGVRLFDFKERQYFTFNDLEPHTHYDLTLRLWDKNRTGTYSFSIETRYRYFEYVGTQEMDLNYDEVTISKINVLPNGDMIERLPNMVRCVNAQGKVRWRNHITPDRLNVTSTGKLMAIYNSSHALYIDAYSGSAKTKYFPPQEISIGDACMGDDGSAVIVSSRRLRTLESWQDEYFIGHYDASGKALKETYYSLNNWKTSNNLIFVSPLPQGGYVAIGTLKNQMEVITLDEECNIGTRFVREYLASDLMINSVCFDSQGNAYFLGYDNEYYEEYCWYCKTAIIFKLNTSGEIDWICKYDSTVEDIEPVMMKMVNDHCVILLKDRYVVLNSDGTELLNKPLGKFKGAILNVFPQDSTYTNCLIINNYGNIYRLRTDGYY